MMSVPSPAEAYWNQRLLLSANRDTILGLCKTISRSVDLNPYQWAQLIAYALTFQPDLILELGRCYGNSTCAFTQAANWMKPQRCEVVSVCRSTGWQSIAAKLKEVVGQDGLSLCKFMKQKF